MLVQSFYKELSILTSASKERRLYFLKKSFCPPCFVFVLMFGIDRDGKGGRRVRRRRLQKVFGSVQR